MIQKKLLLYLVGGFILATIIGTILHEGGHYIANKLLGYDARITYKATVLIQTELRSPRSGEERFIVSMAGPLQTMLTGSLGLLLLYLFRYTFNRKDPLKPKQWILVFVTLFWLRQVILLVMWVVASVTNSNNRFNADEIKMSRYLGLPESFFLWITGAVAAFVLGIVLFRFIPTAQRKTFILAGIIGGIGGYVLWFGLLGRMLLP